MSGCREPLACILSHELTLYYNPHATARFTDIATQQCHTCFCALHNEIMLKRLVPPALVSTGNRKVPYVTARLIFFLSMQDYIHNLSGRILHVCDQQHNQRPCLYSHLWIPSFLSPTPYTYQISFLSPLRKNIWMNGRMKYKEKWIIELQAKNIGRELFMLPLIEFSIAFSTYQIKCCKTRRKAQSVPAQTLVPRLTKEFMVCNAFMKILRWKLLYSTTLHDGEVTTVATICRTLIIAAFLTWW